MVVIPTSIIKLCQLQYTLKVLLIPVVSMEQELGSKLLTYPVISILIREPLFLLKVSNKLNCLKDLA